LRGDQVDQLLDGLDVRRLQGALSHDAGAVVAGIARRRLA
jgi:hypothetical protein